MPTPASPLPPGRLRVFSICATVALAAWWFLPGTSPDRAAFSAVSRAFFNPPTFIGGFGSRETPWHLRTFSPTSRPDPNQAPLVINITDDPAGIFQSSPPSPVDMAVIFANLQRLGVEKAACAAILSWESPDMIGMTALERQIDRFESFLMAAPLARGASASAMPPAIRRASLPVSSIHGNPSNLPRVNRLALPDLLFSGQNTLAGFSTLDSEQASNLPFMLARWDDRVVPAFALLTILQRFEIPLDSLEVRLGQFVRLGKHGPIIPIDAHGRLLAPPPPCRPAAEIAAESLIDSPKQPVFQQAPQPVILRDTRGLSDPQTRAFSRQIAPLTACLAAGSGLAQPIHYRRPGAAAELVFLAVVCGTLSFISRLPRQPRTICLGMAAAACMAAQWFAFTSSIWLPGLAALAACTTAAVLAIRFPTREIS